MESVLPLSLLRDRRVDTTGHRKFVTKIQATVECKG